MPSLVEDIEQSDKARYNLKKNDIKVNLDTSGNLTFIVPKSLEETLKREYNFSVEQLSVGGDIPLPDLAVHVDQQASMEAYAGQLAEFVRHQLKKKQDEYELWYNGVFYKVKKYMQQSGEKNITDKGVSSRISFKHAKRIKKFNNEISELEFKFRMLNNVIKSSIQTKGVMLPTLRNIVQGKDSGGIGNVPTKIQRKVRKKLQITRSNDNG